MRTFKLQLLIAQACLVCFSALSAGTVSAAAIQWTNPDAGLIVETYASTVLAQGIEGISGEFKYNPVTDSGSLIINGSVDEYPNLQIGISVMTTTAEQIRASQEDTEKHGQMTSEYSGEQKLFIPTREAAEKYQTVRKEEYLSYTSLSRAFCDVHEINVSVYIHLSEKLLPQTDYYLDLADRLSRDTLADAVTSTGLCSSKKDKLLVKIVGMEGEVVIKRGEADYVPAKIGDILRAGDYLATGFESTAIFEVVGMGAMLEVRPMTNFSVSQVFYDGNLARTAINLRLGEVTTNIKPEKGVKASFQIVTPTVTIGTRGTIFQTSVAESGSTNVYVTEGALDVLSNKTNESIILKQGEKAYVGMAGAIEVTAMDSDTVLQEDGLVTSVHAVYGDQQNLTWLLLGAVIVLSLLLWAAVYFFIKRKRLLGTAFLIVIVALIVAGGAFVAMNPPGSLPTTEMDTAPAEETYDKKTVKAIAESQQTIQQPAAGTTEETMESGSKEQPDQDNEQDQNIKSPPDFAFAINLAPFNDKINFTVAETSEVEVAYPACYQVGTVLDDGSGNCPAGSVEVFRISLYSPDSVLEMKSNPLYEGTFLVLYEFADGGAYWLEWPNGDYPEEIQGIDQDYFLNIGDTFMLQFGTE